MLFVVGVVNALLVIRVFTVFNLSRQHSVPSPGRHDEFTCDRIEFGNLQEKARHDDGKVHVETAKGREHGHNGITAPVGPFTDGEDRVS